MKKILIIIFITFFCLLSFSENQEEVNINEHIRNLLFKKIATISDAIPFAVYFIDKEEKYIYANLEKQRKFLIKKKVIGKNDKMENKLIKGKLANILMKSTDTPGGLLYTIFRTDRYAYREFVFLKVYPKRGSQWQLVSGSDLISIVNRWQDYINHRENVIFEEIDEDELTIEEEKESGENNE